jgi:hypothetical protein
VSIKKQKFSTLLIFMLVTVVALGLLVTDAQTYQFYSDNTNDQGQCAQCHTGFRDNNNYVSQAEGVSWGDSLHNVHVRGTTVGNNCDNCHGGAGTSGRTVRINSSLAAADGVNAIACIGCHGRDEGGLITGTGLRQHHFNNGVTLCLGCHPDSDLAGVFGPAIGEDTMPPWYGSIINDGTGTNLAPCNAGDEEQLAGLSIGLDNDGDNVYDTLDADCVVAVCGNGVLEPGEECDDGANNGTTTCGCQLDCTYTPAGTPCPDGQFCNGDETCDGTGLCQAGTAVDCDDGVGCTDDSCDEVNDECVNDSNDLNCPDDGAFCNGDEFCNPTLDCSSTGDPCPLGTSCNEGTDTCDPIAGCGNGQVDPGEDCDPSVAGTVCCEGDCTFTPAGISCDADGLFCNGTDTCDGLGTCDPGVPPDCDDGVGCTDDSCNETTDQCDNIPNDGLCDDTLFCNGVETCDPVNDCQAGTPVDCDDGVGCTDDSCDEVNDQCVNTVNDANCPDDGAFCNGDEFCDAQLDCQSTGNPCPPGEVCDELTDTCEVSEEPPPVMQNLGFPDSSIADLTEEDCRFCHEDPNIVDDANIPNRHHLLVGASVTDPTVRPFPDGDTNGNYDCFSCHQLVWDPNTSSFVLETFRDCIFCHNTGSPHHTTVAAQAQLCDTCHGFVNNPFDGHIVPTYQPSLVTPTRSQGDGLPLNSRGNGAGACNYCHDNG